MPRSLEDRDRLVGLMHVACRRLRHAIEVLDEKVPPEEEAVVDLRDCQRIVNGLVEELCPKS